MVRPALVGPPVVWSVVASRLTRLALAALIAATAVAAFVLWDQVVRDLAPYEVRISWWALAAGFACAELLVVHVHVRGSAHSLSLSELPLVLGLLLAEPSQLVVATVVGPAVVLACTRGQSPVRLLFNLAQFALTAALATIVLHAIAPPPATIGPLVWGATFAAVLVSALTGAALVFSAISLAEGSIPPRRLAGMLGADLLVALANTSVALSAATIVAEDPRAAWLLIPPAAVLLLAYRAWVSERAKHQSLELLYGVTSRLSGESELLDLLRRTRASFRARTAELVLLTGDGAVRTADGPNGYEAMAPLVDAPALRAAVDKGRAVRTGRERCEPALRRYLEERDIEEALIAPVRGETRLAGVMVLGDRIGSTDQFTDQDLRLFEALAAHAGLSLELDRLERQAQSDPLTGLANRTLFLRRVEASLERPSGMATVLFLDLDDFKAINDRAGHGVGDAALVAAAGRIEASVRPGDVAARIGGDEFAVLLEDVDDHHGEQVAGRILELLAEPVAVAGQELWVRSSVGVASAAAGSIDSGALLHRADVAMYRAKEAGKNQLRVWPAEEGGRPADELAEALARGELVAHFQPIVALDGGAVVAAEALARWRHPRRGLLGAASFLLGADDELAAAVDRAVLAQACAEAARGAFPAVHVNQSALDERTVRDVLDSTGLDPAQLVLELPERALAAAPAEAIAALQAIGVRIAFDDFGNGRRAVELLLTRDIDMLKVARSFVEGAGRAGHDRAVLAMVIQLGEFLELDVVAQGIEREDQRAALALLGCELGQGHLLGRPLPLPAALAA
jgi:diguanylate cyclase (GGDEF)-like protein